MTCIVSWIEKGNIYMGGDAGAADMNIEVVMSNPKVTYNSEAKMLFGYMGSYRMAQLLEYQLKIPEQVDHANDLGYMVRQLIPEIRKCFKEGKITEVHDEVEEGGSFLIGYKSKIYKVQPDFSVVIPADSYCSIGSGYIIATGALAAVSHYDDIEPIEKLCVALVAAEKHLSYIRRPFTVMKMDSHGKLIKVYKK